MLLCGGLGLGLCPMVGVFWAALHEEIPQGTRAARLSEHAQPLRVPGKCMHWTWCVAEGSVVMCACPE